MSEEADNEDRTEEPTQRKLDQAAEKGDIPRSQEIGTFFVLCGFTWRCSSGPAGPPATARSRCAPS